MPIIEDNGITVGPWPLPMTLARADILAGLVTPGVGSIELRPLPFENLSNAIAEGDISGIFDYVAPYQVFTVTVTVLPEGDEVIQSVSFDPSIGGLPLPVLTPFAAILEEPNPMTLPSRTGTDKPQIIPPSGMWSPPSVNEPSVISFGGTNTATLAGFYTEKAFFDRRWILKFPDCVARIGSDGIRYLRFSEIPQGVALEEELFDTAPILPSGITPLNWYPVTRADAEILDSPLMEPLLRKCEGIISYKASEIRKLRFFYNIIIVTDKGTSFKPVFMTVQNQQKWTQSRLQYALALPKTPTNLLPPLTS